MTTATLQRDATLPPGDTAPDSSAAQPLLRMTVGGSTLAVPIAEVREILEVGRLTAIPRTPAFVRGVMNLRGAVVPVIDLAARLGHGPVAIGRRSCVVVVEGRDVGGDGDEAPGAALPFGLLVDGVHEVLEIGANEVEAVPPLGTEVDARYLAGITRARGELVPVLELPQVLAADELGQLIAAHVAPTHETR